MIPNLGWKSGSSTASESSAIAPMIPSSSKRMLAATITSNEQDIAFAALAATSTPPGVTPRIIVGGDVRLLSWLPS